MVRSLFLKFTIVLSFYFGCVAEPLEEEVNSTTREAKGRFESTVDSGNSKLGFVTNFVY